MLAPAFSVVIPTRDRAQQLERVLAGYGCQEPAELPFEVVVVDDGSSEGTAELLRSWQSPRFSLVWARQEPGGPAQARNYALRLAAGTIVLFTGDDVEPSPGLLAEHWRQHVASDDPRVAVLGLTRWPEGLPLTATMRHVDGVGAQQFSYHFMRDGEEYDFRHFYTSNVSVHRILLDREADGFCTAFPAAAWEDAELAYRLSRHGLRIVYRAAALAFHHHRYDAASFFSRQVRSGEMACRLWEMHPQLKRWLGVRELERLRTLAASSPRQRDSLVESVRLRLPELEATALRVAGFFDPLEVDAVDRFLLPLFRYAYLKGLAASLYAPAVAERLAASLLLALLCRPTLRLSRELDAVGAPRPVADLEALRAVSSEQ